MVYCKIKKRAKEANRISLSSKELKKNSTAGYTELDLGIVKPHFEIGANNINFL